MNDATMTATLELEVNGMTCGACERHVGEALAEVPGVAEVAVDRERGTATVTAGAQAPSLTALVEALAAAGYDAHVTEAGGATTIGPASSCCGGQCCEVTP